MAKIEKTFNGKRFTYLCNGEVYKNSTKDYKYACVATTRQVKGASQRGMNSSSPLATRLNQPTILWRDSIGIVTSRL